VLGDAFGDPWRRMLDVPAYWLVYLPLEFPAFYPLGVAMLVLLLREREDADERRSLLAALALLAVIGLVTGWLLRSIVGDNNDLGWRAVLPAVLLLIAFAAAGLARMAGRRRVLAAFAAFGFLLGLPDGLTLMRSNIRGEPSSATRAFAGSPALWEAVRRHSSPTQRVANSPLFLRDATRWPVNISWALLADRRSCYAGYSLAVPFAPVSPARREEVDAQFVRVFEGQAAPADAEQLMRRFQCDLVVVTPQDGAWARDPFASSDLFRLVEQKPDAWRIYRKAAPGS
jgi:hypothetical protein